MTRPLTIWDSRVRMERRNGRLSPAAISGGGHVRPTESGHSRCLSLLHPLSYPQPLVICIEIAARFREGSKFEARDIGAQPNAHEPAKRAERRNTSAPTPCVIAAEVTALPMLFCDASSASSARERDARLERARPRTILAIVDSR